MEDEETKSLTEAANASLSIFPTLQFYRGKKIVFNLSTFYPTPTYGTLEHLRSTTECLPWWQTLPWSPSPCTPLFRAAHSWSCRPCSFPPAASRKPPARERCWEVRKDVENWGLCCYNCDSEWALSASDFTLVTASIVEARRVSILSKQVLEYDSRIETRICVQSCQSGNLPEEASTKASLPLPSKLPLSARAFNSPFWEVHYQLWQYYQTVIQYKCCYTASAEFLSEPDRYSLWSLMTAPNASDQSDQIKTKVCTSTPTYLPHFQ